MTVLDWYDCRVWMDVTGQQPVSQPKCPIVAVGYILMYMLQVYMTVQAILVCASMDELTLVCFFWCVICFFLCSLVWRKVNCYLFRLVCIRVCLCVCVCVCACVRVCMCVCVCVGGVV